MVRLRPERAKPAAGTKEEQAPGDGTPELENKATTPQEEPVTIVAVPEKEEKEDEATAALKKQIEALRRSETFKSQQVAQLEQQRAEWVKQQQEARSRLAEIEKQSQEQEEVAVGAALAAATAEADKAQSDISRAMEAQDWSAFADAQRRLARAEANATRLQTGKEEIEARKKAPKPEQQERPQYYVTPGSDEHINMMELPRDCKDWLREHRQYLTDQIDMSRLGTANLQARQQGFAPGHPEYLPAIENFLGMRKEEPVEDKQEQQRQSAIVSAPVSREVPDASGQRSTRKVTLSAAQREIAALAGISETEYAKQLQKLNQMKSDGEYGERR